MEQLSESEQEKWDTLLQRARMMLDDAGIEQERKRKEVAKKQLERAGVDEPPVDLAAVKRVLIVYAATKRYNIALETGGATKDDMQMAFRLWPDAKTVLEYVQNMRDEQRTSDMEELELLATDALKALLKDSKGKNCVNPKLVMATLERLDRKRFGERTEDAAAKKSGDNDPMVYQITNVQMNLTGNDALRAALPAGGVVDVEAVIKALEVKADG
jgi:hypothetical protein